MNSIGYLQEKLTVQLERAVETIDQMVFMYGNEMDVIDRISLSALNRELKRAMEEYRFVKEDM